jgi:hypothetical protein
MDARNKGARHEFHALYWLRSVGRRLQKTEKAIKGLTKALLRISCALLAPKR